MTNHLNKVVSVESILFLSSFLIQENILPPKPADVFLSLGFVSLLLYHCTVYECVGRSVRSPTHGLPRGTSGKEPACQCRRRGFSLWVRKIPWSRKWQPTAVLLSAESHGQRSLAGCSLGVRRESDTAERLNSHTAQAWSQRLSVMVDVWRQRAWATRFPDMCSNSMLGVSERVFFFF